MPWAALAIALVAVAVAVAAVLISTRGQPVVGVDGAVGLDAGSDGRGGTRSPDPASKAGSALTSQVVVAVSGAVVRPGVYRLRPGSRVADAIEAAGGYGTSVDVGRVDRELNLAATVKDGEKIRVPVRGEAAATGSGGGTGAAGSTASAPIDLNTASAEALDTLPGVGPATAAKIIAAREERPFAGVDDLLARKIVGEATLEKLRPLVTAGS